MQILSGPPLPDHERLEMMTSASFSQLLRGRMSLALEQHLCSEAVNDLVAGELEVDNYY